MPPTVQCQPPEPSFKILPHFPMEQRAAPGKSHESRRVVSMSGWMRNILPSRRPERGGTVRERGYWEQAEFEEDGEGKHQPQRSHQQSHASRAREEATRPLSLGNDSHETQEEEPKMVMTKEQIQNDMVALKQRVAQLAHQGFETTPRKQDPRDNHQIWAQDTIRDIINIGIEATFSTTTTSRGSGVLTSSSAHGNTGLEVVKREKQPSRLSCNSPDTSSSGNNGERSPKSARVGESRREDTGSARQLASTKKRSDQLASRWKAIRGSDGPIAQRQHKIQGTSTSVPHPEPEKEASGVVLQQRSGQCKALDCKPTTVEVVIGNQDAEVASNESVTAMGIPGSFPNDVDEDGAYTGEACRAAVTRGLRRGALWRLAVPGAVLAATALAFV